ncbi:MAG: hypothetical protein AABZ30_04160 [Myxococcota bacterium]
MSKSLAEAVAELRRDPRRAVRARVDDLEVELRAVGSLERPERLGSFLASLGPWEGESSEQLLDRLRKARDSGGSADPPAL